MTRTEHTASTWHPWRRCAGRSVGRIWSCANVSEPVWISVKLSQGRWLKIKRTVYKVFWRPKGNRWRRVRKRLSGRRWRWAVQRPLKCTRRSGNSGFHLWRRRLSWWNSRRVIIRFHISLGIRSIVIKLLPRRKRRRNQGLVT